MIIEATFKNSDMFSSRLVLTDVEHWDITDRVIKIYKGNETLIYNLADFSVIKVLME